MTAIITVNFDGIDLSNILIVKNVDRGIRLGRSMNHESRKNKKGVQSLGYSSELVEISMDFGIINNVLAKRNDLSNILNVAEPKPLIFSDEPHRVYYAYPNGNVNVEESNVTGEGTIIWQVPDGVSYSLQEFKYTNRSITNELLDMFVVDNPGTESMDLSMEAKFSSNNGFIGIENEVGDVRALIGDIAEIDGFDYQTSDQLFNDHFYQNRGWSLNDGVIPPVAGNMKQQGTFSYKTEIPGEGFAYPTNYGAPGQTWTGPSLTKAVPADVNGKHALNWASTFRLDFNTDGGGSNKDKSSQVGHQSVTFIDQNNQIIAAIVIEDNNPSAEKSDFAVYVKDRRVYDSRNTSSYYNTARPGSGNHIRVEKMGGRVTVELAGIGFKQSFPYPDRTSELRKITFYSARFKDRRPIHNNLIRALNVIKHHVDKWEDIPNKFKNGDLLEYGKGGRNIYCLVNEMNELRMRDVGSTLITAPPGISRFYIAYSDFSNIPEIILKGRAKYT